LVFVRRDKVSPDWLARREYRSRFAFDPYWVERAYRRGKISLETLEAEIGRNAREAGWHRANLALAKALEEWRREFSIEPK
jgi:hypothetical protein